MPVADDSGRSQPAPADDGGTDAAAMASTLAADLLRRSATVATAESVTGGALGDLLSAAPGASNTYLGGVISYATDLKQRLLDVSPATIQRHGVVSAECATEMALGARSITGADYAVSTTGVAGPAEQEGKPVGLVYLAVAGPDGVAARELRLHGVRAEIRAQICREAVSAVTSMLAGAGGGVGDASLGDASETVG